MMLAATRFGAAPALAAELAASQPDLLKYITRSVPDMYPKAYRWVAEMQEVAAFVSDDAATRDIYTGIAALYDSLATRARTASWNGFGRRGVPRVAASARKYSSLIPKRQRASMSILGAGR